jgi:hypothetical protein
MITGMRIVHVEATREKEAEIAGLSINIALDEVKTTGKRVEIKYTYTCTYSENVGKLIIKGTLFADEDENTAKAIGASWAKDKKLPDGFAELVLNSINYGCGTNGVLVVRAVNLSPPLVPPRIEIAKEGSGAKSS